MITHCNPLEPNIPPAWSDALPTSTAKRDQSQPSTSVAVMSRILAPRQAEEL
jgi:hypothetical protein